MSGFAIAAIIAGWGLAQNPTFLPGLTVEEAAADEATLKAMAISVGIGMLILIPSLWLLFRLQLSGRFDEEGEQPAPEIEVARATRPPFSHVAVAALPGIGAAVTFIAEGWLRGAGVAAMLAGASLAFLLLAAPEEEGREEP